MTTNSKRLLSIVIALLLLAGVAAQTNAQCCGGGSMWSAGYTPYTSFYSPYTSWYGGGFSTSYYAPGSTGWYPGYWLDRWRARVWGSPSTYVAAYPSSFYTASYAPSFASYGSSCCPTCSSCSSCPTCASYAPSCPSCSSCSTCASYAPSCSCGSSCGCSSCGDGGCPSCQAQSTYTQASYGGGYSQPSCGCNGGGAQQTANYAPQYSTQYAPQSVPQAFVAPPGTTVIQQNGGTPAAAQPNATAPSTDATFRANRPTEPTPATGPSTPVTPPPTPGANSPYDVNKKDNSTYLQPPALFGPQDRTAQRVMAPVHTAIYEQPASYRPISTAPIKITAEQAERDAAGWSSSAN